VGGVDGRERVRRGLAQPGRQHGHQHCLPGQGVAEAKPLLICGDEDPIGRAGQGAGHQLRGLPAGRGQDLPVEVPTQDRRRLEHGALPAGKLGQPFPHRLADRPGDAGSGQELLDEQRHALGHPSDAVTRIGVGAGGAGGDHLRHLAGGQPAERQVHDARPSPLPPGEVRRRGRRLGPQRHREQQRLAARVVGQVLDQGDHEPVRPQPAQQLQHRLPPDRLRARAAARVSGLVAGRRARQQGGQVRQPRR
jgi:hypothetical protein